VSLAKRSGMLAAAQGAETASQVFVPVLLVRLLDATEFADYRLVWLMLSTLVAVLPLAMPMAMYYFVPRAEGADRSRVIAGFAFYMLICGLVGGVAVGTAFAAGLPQLVRLDDYALWLPVFAATWVAASALDSLPAVEERFRLQAAMMLVFAFLRMGATIAAAWMSKDLGVVLMTLTGVSVVKALVLIGYVARFHRLIDIVRPNWRALSDQLAYALPFGIASILFGLRAQADQWIASLRFDAVGFASFSIAFALAPLVWLIRRAVTSVQMPSMNRLHGSGDLRGALVLNNQANVFVSLVVAPVLAFVLFYAEEGVALVYTSTYSAAADVLRVLMLIWVLQVVELNSILMLLKAGAVSAKINAVLLVLSIVLSWSLAGVFGLPGAALGSVMAAVIERSLLLRRISHMSGIPAKQLQDWRRLATVFAVALFCAAVVHHLSQFAPDSVGALSRLLVSGGFMVCAYFGAVRYLRLGQAA